LSEKLSSRELEVQPTGERQIKVDEEGRMILEAEPDIEEVYRYFYVRRNIDGLPIIPPTRERVERMLKFCDRPANEFLGYFPPRNSIVTPEKIAINCVMAGCIPGYFPVVMHAVLGCIHKARGQLATTLNIEGLITTTHPVHPLTIVNGPVIKELIFNAGHNALGPGWRTNATVGRAISLCMLNLGGGIPGMVSLSTQGSPTRYAYCIAENEEQSPWDPLHVRRGYDRNDSTVTIMGLEGPHNVQDHRSVTGEDLLLSFAKTMAVAGMNPTTLASDMWGNYLVILGPEYARLLKKDGYDIDDIRMFLWTYARLPQSLVEQVGYDLPRIGLMPEWPKWVWNRFDGQIPPTAKPEYIEIIVAGGDGRHGQVMPSFGWTHDITIPLTLADGTPIRSVLDFLNARKARGLPIPAGRAE
jgi:hypothetical protein